MKKKRIMAGKCDFKHPGTSYFREKLQEKQNAIEEKFINELS